MLSRTLAVLRAFDLDELAHAADLLAYVPDGAAGVMVWEGAIVTHSYSADDGEDHDDQYTFGNGQWRAATDEDMQLADGA